MKKVLFVGRSVYHFSYYEFFIRELANRGYFIDLLFDEQWSRGKPDDALKNCLRDCRDNISFNWALRRKRLRRVLFPLRELISYLSYEERIRKRRQSEFYLKRWQSYLPHILRYSVDKFPLSYLLRFKIVRRFLKWLDDVVPPDKQIIEDIKKRNPLVVIASPANMRFCEEIEYIKAANHLGIPTAILVLSWDNLSTKGLFHEVPTVLLVWNKLHYREAIEIHQIPEKNLLISGAFFFDKWFEPEESLLLPQDEICKEMGISPDRPYVLYLGSSANIARDETWLVRKIKKALSRDPVLQNVQLVARPHPANAKV